MEKILRLLELRGYTQLGFERAVGLPRGRISKWKTGQGEPSIREGARIAGLLGISLDDLVDVRKQDLPVNDLTEDERFVVTLMRKARMSGEEVTRLLVPGEKKKAVVRPRRPKPPELRKAK